MNTCFSYLLTCNKQLPQPRALRQQLFHYFLWACQLTRQYSAILPGLSYATTLVCKLIWAGKYKVIPLPHQGPITHSELGNRESPLGSLSLHSMAHPSWPLCGLSLQWGLDILSTWWLGSKREYVDAANCLLRLELRIPRKLRPLHFCWPTHISCLAQIQDMGKQIPTVYGRSLKVTMSRGTQRHDSLGPFFIFSHITHECPHRPPSACPPTDRCRCSESLMNPMMKRGVSVREPHNSRSCSLGTRCV